MAQQSTHAPQAMLKQHGLRLTRSRQQVLQAFIDQPHALSHTDLLTLLGEGHDRVTIYRTLSAFLEKGLIHKVPGDTDATQFALCSGGCNAHAHRDDHVHFKCRVCQRSECLTELAVPEMSLPEGYGVESSNLLLEGVCRECRVA